MENETKQAPPRRKPGEVAEALRPIFSWATHDALRCVQVRNGLIAATDGRVLARVEMPGFRAFEPAASASVASVLDFVPEEGRVVAGREWIRRELALHVEVDWAEVRAGVGEKRAKVVRDTVVRTRRCPCCGEELVADECGELYTPDQWIDGEAPSEQNATERVELSTNVGAEICVFLRDLARALDVARKLGGADALRIGRGQLRLDGAGFVVVVVRALADAQAFRRFLIERGDRAEEVRT